MSYRELRDFTEILRTLGFPRQVSLDNFRQPNFRLVAEVLHWLVNRYDPLASVPDSIETEDDRVDFVVSAVEAIAARSGVKLKAKLLGSWWADRGAAAAAAGGVEDHSGALASRLADVSSMREAASELVEGGARLHDLLGEEGAVREERTRALRFLDSLGGSGGAGGGAGGADVERTIREAVEAVAADVAANEKQCVELEADAQALEAKIAKRQAELERMTKRLESLRTVRPAFAGEYERLETELASEWASFVTKHRNVEYLEAELSALERRDRETADAHRRALRKLQQKLREEELAEFRGDEHVDEAALSRPSDHAGGSGGVAAGFGLARPQSRPGRTREEAAAAGASRVVAGRMMAPRGGGDDDDDDQDDQDDAGPRQRRAHGDDGDEDLPRRRPGRDADSASGDPRQRPGPRRHQDQDDDDDDDDDDLDDDLSDDQQGDDDGGPDAGADDDDDDDDMF